ncbi:MAG TPA: hypothetical protein VHY31_14580 [Streptosporangiaceae bacterium]|nr:hypothetical protein [Streptosporangiaceae bacterium]
MPDDAVPASVRNAVAGIAVVPPGLLVLLGGNCSGCGEPVSDRGRGSGPRYDETGHGDGCPVLAAAAAGWDAGRPAPG